VCVGYAMFDGCVCVLDMPYLIPEYVLDIPCLIYECVMLVSVSIRYAYFKGNCACHV